MPYGYNEIITFMQLNMSHNVLSFLTRTSLPTQETLRSVDFSYNRVPVLTHDFALRSRRIRHLNFSHNILNEIREGNSEIYLELFGPKPFALLQINYFHQITGVFDNLTSLFSLDLSHNELFSLASSHYSKLPPNLVELNIANNNLGKLPIRALSKLKLKLLDVRNNMLPVFSHELMKAIENGTTVLYSGT